MVSASKPAQAQKIAKNPNLEAPKPAQTQKNAKNAKPRYNVRGQGLIGLDFCICCILFEPVQVLEPWMFKTCTGSKKCKKCKSQMQCQRSGLDWSGLLHFLHFLTSDIASGICIFCIFLSLCSLGCLKAAQAQKNAKNPNLEAPKPAQAHKNAKNAKPRCNVRGQGLSGLDFCIFCISWSLCRF